jgi:(R,R)-butanediol dehydrogenase/meso-butanediol dehydrogenase/diacetyl reductase
MRCSLTAQPGASLDFTVVRVIEIAEDRSLAVVERPSPEPGPGRVVIDIAYCGICGSDLHFRDVPALFPAGTVPGHEMSGAISAVGDGVSGWSEGDRVSVLPFAQCGECAACRAGTEQVCGTAVANGVGLGTGRPGGYAERVLVDAQMLFALPDAVDDRAGTLVEPAAVAVHAVGRAQVLRGERVAVLGAGPIGLLTALVARENGAEVVLVSRNAGRARGAEKLGLRAVGPDEAVAALAGEAPAVVMECAGTGAAAELAIGLVAPLGRVVMVGMALAPFPLDPLPLIFKEVDVRGSIIYRRGDFDTAIALLAGGQIPSADLISGQVGFDRAEETFQSLMAPGNQRVKVLLDPAG